MRYTRSLAQLVIELSALMTLSDIARFTHLSWDTVKAIVKEDLRLRYKRVALKHIKRIAIDELYLGKRAKFVTLVIDLDSGRVLHVGKGKGGEALKAFWHKLRAANAKIKAVACDMSSAYWAAIIEHLPRAAIVFDQLTPLRFALRAACGCLSRSARLHIIKLANSAIDEVRRGIQRVLDLTGRKAIKGKRYLLLRGRENLSEEQLPSLEEALKWNEPLSQAYYLKEDLRDLWDQPDRASAKAYLKAWIKRAEACGLYPMQRLANTMRLHMKGVLNYFIHPISSGMMEGINNKIGRMTRLAYGCRDTEFLHLKILSLHESNLKLSGV